MRQFVVSEAPVSRVARHVRETVEDAGGIVAHHTARKTEFDHLDHGDQAWRRAGYVGTYQRFKEKPVRVRIRVWAQWPRRLLAGSIYLGFAVALVFLVLSIGGAAIPPNAWIFSSLPILAVIAAAFLMYTSSISDSEGAEQRIEALLVERLQDDDEIPGVVYDLDDWDDYRQTLIDEAREDARERAPYGGSRIRRAIADVGESVGSLGSDDEPAEADTGTATYAEPGATGQKEAEGSEPESPGRLAGLKTKLGLGEGADEAEEPDEAKGDEDDEGEEEDSPGALAGLKARFGLGAESEEEDEAGQPVVDEDEGSDEGAEHAAS